MKSGTSVSKKIFPFSLTLLVSLTLMVAISGFAESGVGAKEKNADVSVVYTQAEAARCFKRPSLLISDYDGTLTPIIKNYQDAYLTKPQLATLKRASRLKGVQLAILSGRAIDQLLPFLKTLRGESILLMGQYGGELYDLKTGQFVFTPDEHYKTNSRLIKQYLSDKGILTLPNVGIEDKTYTMVLHTSGATPENAEKAVSALEMAMEQNPDIKKDFAAYPGPDRVEILPRDFNKGKGIRDLKPYAAKALGTDDFNVVFLGDSTGDFPAFEAVNESNGCSIYVKPETSTESPVVTKTVFDINSTYGFLKRFAATRP